MKYARTIVVAILLVACLPGAVLAGTFSLRLTGGYGYGLFGDVNAGTRGLFNFYKDQALLAGGSFVENLRPVHFGPTYGADLIYSIDSEFSIALGVGYFRSKRQSDLALLFPDQPEIAGSVFHDVRAIPVRISVIDTRHIVQGISAYFEGGAEAVFAEYREIFTPPEVGGVGDSSKATAVGWGLHYAMGLQFEVMSHLAFVVEGRGIFAQVRHFSGTIQSTDPANPFQESGLLYRFDLLGGAFGATPYPMILIMGERPSGPQYTNVRLARVDFSGFSLQAGIKFTI